MGKQEQLNDFVSSLGDFLAKYYASVIDDVSLQIQKEWRILQIDGPGESELEVWTEGAEITIVFAESHWHIDDYSDPCDMQSIYKNTIDSVLEIFQKRLGTYSCWRKGHPLGGATFAEANLEEVVEAATSFFKGCDEVYLKRWGTVTERVKI